MGSINGIDCVQWWSQDFTSGYQPVAQVTWITMVLDSLSSPHRRAQQSPFAPLSPSFRKQLLGREESSSWSILFHRHRFLLTTLAVLCFLCTIYLYFAVTLGASESCAGLIGTEAALCSMERAKASMSQKGKLKFF